MRETAAPEQVGLSSGRMAELRAAMQALIDEGRYAGISTLIARRGQVVDFRQYGKLDLAADKPLLPDSLFRIASLTKPITAVAALILFDEGAFGLDDPVSRWLPEFKTFKVVRQAAGETLETDGLETEITIRHLLTHTSGLGYGVFGGPIESLYAGADIHGPMFTLRHSLPEFIQQLPALPLVAQPGAIWNYSLAYDVLGYLIEVISGDPLDVFFFKRIFEPLGMADTFFCVPADKRHRLGPLYKARGEAAALTVELEVDGSPFVNPGVAPSGGVGLVSSMPDYGRFMSMLANGGALDGVRILQPGTAAAMTTNQLPSSAFEISGFSPGDGYGLGVAVRVAADPAQGLPAGAFGWRGVSGTTAWVYPREEMIVICLAQSFIDFAAARTLLRLAYAAIET